MKHCARCRQEKPASEFPKASGPKAGPHGLQAYCRPCSLEKNREWRLANPDKSRAIARRAYWRDAEKHRASRRDLTPAQRLSKNAGAQKYRKANPAKVAMWNRLRRLRERAAGDTPTPHEIGAILCSQDARCIYCAMLIAPSVRFDIDHKTPVSRGGSNDIANLQIACPTCNMKKQSKTHEEYMAQLRAAA